jgi:polynucleotide 5'-kinase involved in rRNA processing
MDNVAEWLTRLTANQFLSGAQVRVLPLSLFNPLLFGCFEKKKNYLGVAGSTPALGFFL